MKPIITEAELRFLLNKNEINETQLQQMERLETCASILRALRVLYPEKARNYLALFIIFSIINPLEHKFITPLHPQLVLLSITIVTNCIGLTILKFNGADWISTSLTEVQIGLPPPVSVYRSAIITLAATLFLLPGVVLSIIAAALLAPPITNIVATRLHNRILQMFK